MILRNFHTVLVANRGEIAVRVIRTLAAMGIRSVAVYSDADAEARHVAEADIAVRIGPPPARLSYLNIEALVAAAVKANAQAVHPGYGFLSENADFAAALDQAGVVFIGPSATAIHTMGDKIAAKAAVSAYGVPVIPGVAHPGMSDADLIAAADHIGYPVLVKPSAGGGGKGMRRVDNPTDLPAALISARRESGAAFGNDTLFIERFISHPRHIEVQVLADHYGTVLHLGERECSLQRRHQKIIEEAPSVLLDAAARSRIGVAACDTARCVDYVGAGTVEFIVSADRPDEFFFMEMNTRLQVEHPVTEMVTGWDVVEWQVRIAAGEKLSATQDDIALRGHAIEARVYAENPATGFLPTGGRVLNIIEPHGPGIRCDSGVSPAMVIGTDYDPLLTKIIAHADDRTEALGSLTRALSNTVVLGVDTNNEFLRFLLADEDVISARLDTALVDRKVAEFIPELPHDEEFIAAAAYHWIQRWPCPGVDLWDIPSGWRIGANAAITIALSSGSQNHRVSITGIPDDAIATVADGAPHRLSVALTDNRLLVTIDGIRRTYVVAVDKDQMWLAHDGRVMMFTEMLHIPIRADNEHHGDVDIVSSMPGSIVAVEVSNGATVSAGTVLVVVEAMKMEHPLTAPVDGIVELLVHCGDHVTVGQSLATITTEASREDVPSL